MRPGPDGPDPDFRREACLGVCLCVRGVFLPGFVLTVPNVCISPAGDRHAILTFFSLATARSFTPLPIVAVLVAPQPRIRVAMGPEAGRASGKGGCSIAS